MDVNRYSSSPSPRGEGGGEGRVYSSALSPHLFRFSFEMDGTKRANFPEGEGVRKKRGLFQATNLTQCRRVYVVGTP